MVMSPMEPPVRGEDLRSINEAAELTSVPVTEERIHVAEVKQNVTDQEERKYHGMSCSPLLLCSFVYIKSMNSCVLY